MYILFITGVNKIIFPAVITSSLNIYSEDETFSFILNVVKQKIFKENFPTNVHCILIDQKTFFWNSVPL